LSGTRIDNVPPVAVVDIGSNSVRLFLWEGTNGEGPSGPRLTTVTGLRRGAAPDGRIARDALSRLSACVANYGEMMRARGVLHGVALGTSAIRDAPNSAAVARIIGVHLGLPLTIVSGTVEARLAYAGARLAVDDAGPAIVLDVGGGSTELVRGDAKGPTGAVSLQIGAVRSTEAYLHADPPHPDELARLREDVDVALADAVAGIGGPAPLVGVAGTASTLAAIDLGIYDPRRVHGHVLTRTRVEEMLSWMSGLPIAERALIPGLEPARAPVIVAGTTIVAVALAAVGADAMRVSERDLLDGAVLYADSLIGPIGTLVPQVATRWDLP
jgi:exopolyphosphatase/guanosine-5'-triphosphate,3'-diphosphate pyrophosphatase